MSIKTKEESLAKELDVADYDLPNEIFCYHTKEREAKDFTAILRAMDSWAEYKSIKLLNFIAKKNIGTVAIADKRTCISTDNPEKLYELFEKDFANTK